MPPSMERRWQQLQSGRSVTTEYRIITEEGRHRWLRDHARPLWNEATEDVSRILGAARDITDRKQAEEEARRHQDALAHVSRLSMLGELTGQLAHELNQPLCTVVGNAQTALRLLGLPVPDVAELRSALDDIVAAGKHAGEVIRRLRSLVRQQESQPTRAQSGTTHGRGGRLYRGGCSTPRSDGAVRHRPRPAGGSRRFDPACSRWF